MLALVCQRFWQLLYSPQLLHSVCLTFPGQSWMPRLRGLCRWVLLHAAGSVRQLRLGSEQYAETEQLATEAEALVTSMAVACAVAGGGLEELELSGGCLPVVCSSWMAALRRLRRLKLHCNDAVEVNASLETLSNLEELEFSCDIMRLLPTAALPPFLTKLTMRHTDNYTGGVQSMCPPSTCPSRHSMCQPSTCPSWHSTRPPSACPSRWVGASNTACPQWPAPRRRQLLLGAALLPLSRHLQLRHAPAAPPLGSPPPPGMCVHAGST